MDKSNYYEGIAHNKPMTLAQEQSVFREYHNESTSETRRSIIRDEVLRANMRFVFKMAKKYSKNDVEQFEDLIAAGNEGLLVGFYKFDYESGHKFLTYAGWWVKQRILKEMSKFRVVSLPIWKQQLASRIHHYVEQNEGRTVTIDELCDHLPKAKRSNIEELYETRYLTYGISDVFAGEEDNIEDSQVQFDEQLEIDDIQAAVDELPEPQKTIVCMSYGLGEYSEYAIKDIIEVLDIDRKTFRSMKNEALALMEERLESFRS